MAPSGNEHPHTAGDARNSRARAGTQGWDKPTWRRALAADRADVAPAERVADAGRLAELVRPLAGPGRTVCGYVPFGTEPGSLAVLDVLRTAGARVLLPVVPAARGPLDWTEYTGASGLAAGRFPGVLEPSGPLLGPGEIATADLVLVPAQAVDHQGVRLGRGAAFYDQSLTLCDGARFVAVVRDAELVPELPAEPHDVLMHAALLPRRGLVPLPCSPLV